MFRGLVESSYARPALRVPVPNQACVWSGLFLLMDRDARSVPAIEGVTATEEGLAILVHHAQDVDFDGLEDDELVPLADVEERFTSGTVHAVRLTSAAPSRFRRG